MIYNFGVRIERVIRAGKMAAFLPLSVIGTIINSDGICILENFSWVLPVTLSAKLNNHHAHFSFIRIWNRWQVISGNFWQRADQQYMESDCRGAGVYFTKSKSRCF